METKINIINAILTRQYQIVINTEFDRNYWISKFMTKPTSHIVKIYYELTGLHIKPITTDIFYIY